MTPSANTAYRSLLETVANCGLPVAPRSYPTVEMIGYNVRVDMNYPIITIPSRKLNYRFMAAEAHWILSGRQELADLSPYCEKYADYSDDGIILSGAYGPRFVSQARYVVESIVTDQFTRQAVISIWERNPRPSKDIPCTVSLQWLLRDNKLHCIANMRSSDTWLGWPYDVFTFTMMSCYIVALANKGWELGTLRVLGGSQHLYRSNFEEAIKVYSSDPKNDGDILPMCPSRFLTPDVIKNALRSAMECSNELVINQLQKGLCE